MNQNKKNKDNKNNNENKKRKSSLRLLFGNLFGGKSEGIATAEEQVQSPFRTIMATFMENKVAMTGIIIFVIIFAIVTIGPIFSPIDLSYSETSQINVAPGYDFMKFPEELEGNVADIDVGPTFSLAASTDGELYIWGKTRITSEVNISNLPRDDNGKLIDMGDIVKVAAGYDNAIALNDEGELFAWGSDRQGQTTISPEVAELDNIKELVAGYQSAIALTDDGHSHFFGNTMNNDYNNFHPHQGELAKVDVTADGVLGLTKSGEAVYLGSQQNSYFNVPEDMGNVVDIAASAGTMAAVNDQGKVSVWGNVSGKKGEGKVPELEDDKIISINAGRYHYVAQTENGDTVAWGDDTYKQSAIPKEVADAEIKEVYTDFYQNYAVTEDNELLTWGLKGYLFGTDDLGRDIFGRLLNGGRMSLTIGAVAVIISTIIGVIVGSVSGFFGGAIDMFLQRLSEMVQSLPFLPFAMILSALIGNKLSPKQRIYLIMVILGLLSWTGLQKLVRAQVLSVREQEYVVAARSLGIKERSIIFKHILPNVISVIVVSATLSFATSMLTEASLSFLGFGVPAPQPTWGNMLYGSNNSIVIQNYWWRWVFASIALSVCVICINVVGDGLRDAIDPKSQER